MSTIFTAATAALLFVAPPASPAPTQAVASANSNADAKARKGTAKAANGKSVTAYDFENDFVDGKLISPEGTDVQSRGNPQFESLITIRRTFTDQLEKIARDV